MSLWSVLFRRKHHLSVREAAVYPISDPQSKRVATTPAPKQVEPTPGQSSTEHAEVEISQLIEKVRRDGYDFDTARALGKLGQCSLSALLVALEDPSEPVRRTAASALSDVCDPRAVDPLLVAIRDPSPRVRRSAIIAVAKSAGPRAVSDLVNALTDPEEDVWEMAAMELAAIGTPEALEGVRSVAERWRDWKAWDSELRYVTQGETTLFRAIIPALSPVDLQESLPIMEKRARIKADFRMLAKAVADELQRRQAQTLQHVENTEAKKPAIAEPGKRYVDWGICQGAVL